MNQLDNMLFSVSTAKQFYLRSCVKDFNKKVAKASKEGKCSILYGTDRISKEFNDLLLSNGYAISYWNDFDSLISW